VHAAFNGRNAVREGVDALVVARVPLKSDFHLLALFGLLVVADLSEQRLFGVVEVAHVVDDAPVVLEGLLGFAAHALVDEADLDTAVKERHDL